MLKEIKTMRRLCISYGVRRKASAAMSEKCSIPSQKRGGGIPGGMLAKDWRGTQVRALARTTVSPV